MQYAGPKAKALPTSDRIAWRVKRAKQIIGAGRGELSVFGVPRHVWGPFRAIRLLGMDGAAVLL